MQQNLGFAPTSTAESRHHTSQTPWNEADQQTNTRGTHLGQGEAAALCVAHNRARLAREHKLYRLQIQLGREGASGPAAGQQAAQAPVRGGRANHVDNTPLPAACSTRWRHSQGKCSRRQARLAMLEQARVQGAGGVAAASPASVVGLGQLLKEVQALGHGIGSKGGHGNQRGTGAAGCREGRHGGAAAGAAGAVNQAIE